MKLMVQNEISERINLRTDKVRRHLFKVIQVLAVN